MSALPLDPHRRSAEQSLATSSCWNRIGITGDQSCPELKIHVHCRNCPVFSAMARTFFNRPAPEGYLAEWAERLASSKAPPGEGTEQVIARCDHTLVSVLILRLGREWIAFRTLAVAEVTSPRPVHRIPHRSNSILIGLVNLRGQLQLYISLHGLLGTDAPSGLNPGSRLVVLYDRDRSEGWIFLAEEVLGVHRFTGTQMRSISSSLANSEVCFTQAVLTWQGRSVGLLDEQRVFAALRRSAQ
jgi:chemotaxis-related protein WspD